MTEPRDDRWQPLDVTYRWYTWDSPVGLGLFLVSLAIVAVLVRVVIVGL